jgi:hypothetical protein
MAFLFIYFASESSSGFSIDSEDALGKDDVEDLFEGKWFTVDLASQTDRQKVTASSASMM